MVRRTKQEAQETRALLLDAAEQVFHRRGVSRTTLNDIAEAAGVTRGAIYHHFENKADLFHAMVERVTLPMETARMQNLAPAPGDVLGALRSHLGVTLRRMRDEAGLRRVFEIMTHKVEYVDELLELRDRHIAARERCLVDVEATLRQARTAGQLQPGLNLKRAAVGLHALIDGLIHNWMLAPGSFDLVATGLAATDAFLAGLAMPRDASASASANANAAPSTSAAARPRRRAGAASALQRTTL